MEPAYRMTDALILRNTFVNVCNLICCNAMLSQSVIDFDAKPLFSRHPAALRFFSRYRSEDLNAVAIVKTDVKKPLHPNGGEAARTDF